MQIKRSHVRQRSTYDAGALAPEKPHFETILVKTGTSWRNHQWMLNLGENFDQERLFAEI